MDAATALSNNHLGLTEEPLRCAVAKRQLIADLGELAIKAAEAPRVCLRGDDGSVKG